jgi:AraC family transcriptional regulator
MQRSTLAPPSRTLTRGITPYVSNEHVWRSPSAEGADSTPAPLRMLISRWILSDTTITETTAVTPEGSYTVGVSLGTSDIAFSHDERPTFEGRVTPGMFQITAPGHSARAVFRTPCDVVHLHIPVELVESCYRDASGRGDTIKTAMGDPRIDSDGCLERLARALILADVSFSSYGKMYVDSVSLALVSRLLELRTCSVDRAMPSRPTPLPKWRLRRAIEYVDTHLAQSISLSEVASAVGLSPMHFAAQFRAATGLRPHEYLLQRRIECAQHLLRNNDYSLFDAAQRVGFRSQPHFTTVFKRIVGATPKRWRDSQHTHC